LEEKGLSSKSESKDESTEVAEQVEAQKPAEPTVQSTPPQPEPVEVKKPAVQEPLGATKEDLGTDEAAQQTDEAKGPDVHSFDVMRPQITPGQRSTLTWSISNADSVRIEPGVGVVGTLGSTAIAPAKTTTYTLIARNKTGESRATQRVEVVDQSEVNNKARTLTALDDRKRRNP
jgi:hypothetical protein